VDAGPVVQNLNWLCVPMKSKSGILGAIYVSRAQRGRFSRTDLELLSVVAASAASALESVHLYRETESRLKTLDLLHQISQEITATLDLERVLTTTTLSVKELLGGSTASILTVDGDALTFQVATGNSSAEIKPFRVPLGQGIAGWVVEHKQPVIVDDVQNDPRFFGTLDKKTGFVTQNLIAVPLVVNDRAIGVIEVFNKPGGFTAADQELLATFASSAAFAIENARLYQLAVENGRLERELQVARQVQASLLPHGMPRLPGWELAAAWLPAREVAGDYYDFISLEMTPDQAQKLGLVIADVADKGTPAALFMVNVRSTLRASMFDADSPVHGLTHVNQLVCDDSHDGMFVTLFYAQINNLDGVVTYVNAGHNPPFLLRASANEPELLIRTGMALGVDPSVVFTQRAVTLEAGDFILFYTDGVPDALDDAGQEFGEDCLRELAIAHRGDSAMGMVAAIEAALKAHIGGTPPFDDITLMALKRL
jgi:sigma-B regulation protein RsbU (phosphoserine phosphatase)